MPEIKTEISIPASKQLVWETLTDFESYEYWNPMILGLEGNVKQGGEARMFVSAGRRKLSIPIEFKDVLTKERLSWTVPRNPMLNFFIDAEHYFEIQDDGEAGCRLIHGEKFSGIIPTLNWLLLLRLKRFYIALNKALAAEVVSRKHNTD